MACYCQEDIGVGTCHHCQRRIDRRIRNERVRESTPAIMEKIHQKRQAWCKREDECNRLFLLFVTGQRPDIGRALRDAIRRHNEATKAPPAVPWTPPIYRAWLAAVDKSYVEMNDNFPFQRRKFDEEYAEHVGEWVPPEKRGALEWCWDKETQFNVLREPKEV